jgi:hypothetical protein
MSALADVSKCEEKTIGMSCRRMPASIHVFKQDYADTSRLGSQTSMKKEPLNIDRGTTERKKESVFWPAMRYALYNL